MLITLSCITVYLYDIAECIEVDCPSRACFGGIAIPVALDGGWIHRQVNPLHQVRNRLGNHMRGLERPRRAIVIPNHLDTPGTVVTHSGMDPHFIQGRELENPVVRWGRRVGANKQMGAGIPTQLRIVAFEGFHTTDTAPSEWGWPVRMMDNNRAYPGANSRIVLLDMLI